MGDRNAVQYKPLLQSADSDDEDDIYPMNFTSGASRQTPPVHDDDVMMMTDLRSPPRSEISLFYSRGGDRSHILQEKRRRKKMLVLVLAGCMMMIVGVGAVVLAYFRSEFDRGLVKDVVSHNPHGDWSTFYNDSATESSVTLIDVDGDGLQDIVIGVMQLEQYMKIHSLLANKTMKQACSTLGFQYPCQGQIVAVRGYDGKGLWSTWFRSGMIFLNCDVDINHNSKMDCIATGRESSVQAFDLATGKTLWTIDAEDAAWSGHFRKSWNVYRPLVLQDLDGDSVKDIMVTHGGDPVKEPEDHNREAGRVIFLSGATGKPLGRYWEMPDSKETYMSPITHITANGSTYFLFGSGGETVPGDLMVIMDTDLQRYILGSDVSQPVSSSLHVLFRGKSKGVMVAPVLVNVTGDGTPDILMSAFEGVVSLFDGETLQQVWMQEFPGMESYSTPTPAHFDDDGVIDFMVTWGKGAWPNYSTAEVSVLSGKDGSILWQTNSRTIQMSSDLSLSTTHPQDMLLYRLIGRRGPEEAKTVGNGPHGTAGGGRKKRHLGGHMPDDSDEDDLVPLDNSPEGIRKMCETNAKHYAEDHLTCADNLTAMETEFFLMDGHHAKTPILVHSTMPHTYKYNVIVTAHEPHCHEQVPGHEDQVTACVVGIPKSTTGAVGDVNSDGKPDLILLEALVADTVTDRYSYSATHGDLILSRISLQKALQTGTPTELKLGQLAKGLGESEGKWGKSVEFLSDSSQPWRSFMGSGGDGVYRSVKNRGDSTEVQK